MVTAKRGDWQDLSGNGRPYAPTVHNGQGAHPDAAESDFADVGPAERTAFSAWKAAPPQPSWRDREPRHVHSVKWVDSEGLEHLHVVRADDIDTVLKDVAVVSDAQGQVLQTDVSVGPNPFSVEIAMDSKGTAKPVVKVYADDPHEVAAMALAIYQDLVQKFHGSAG